MWVADTGPESAEVPAQCGWIGVLEAQIDRTERHSAGAPTTARSTITVTTDGAGVVSHADLGNFQPRLRLNLESPAVPVEFFDDPRPAHLTSTRADAACAADPGVGRCTEPRRLASVRGSGRRDVMGGRCRARAARHGPPTVAAVEGHRRPACPSTAPPTWC
jgi:hypothetical protein